VAKELTFAVKCVVTENCFVGAAPANDITSRYSEQQRVTTKPYAACS
jgi:hypothetical protein